MYICNRMNLPSTSCSCDGLRRDLQKTIRYIKHQHLNSFLIWGTTGYYHDLNANLEPCTAIQFSGLFFVNKMILKSSCRQLQIAPPVPIWLQPLCRGDGLGPKPLRHATVSWSDVASRPPRTPVPITDASRIYFHCWQVYFSSLTFQAVENLERLTRTTKKKSSRSKKTINDGWF